MFDTENFLAHYGIPGMKWGKRTARSSRVSGTKSKPHSEDAKVAYTALSKAKKKGLGSLTNKEIQAAVMRQNLEKQYKDLNPSAQAKAAKITQKILAKSGNQLTSAISTKVINTGIDYAVKSIIGEKEKEK